MHRAGDPRRHPHAPVDLERRFYARYVCGLGDTDGDGFGDLLVYSWLSDASYAEVYSGATGSLLHVINGLDGFPLWQAPASDVRDVDGDGLDDIAVLRMGGVHRVLSGFDLSTLVQIPYTPGAQSSDLDVVAGTGDQDGDGVPDLAIGRFYDVPGEVVLRSGATGAPIRTLTWTSTSVRLGGIGFAVDGAGDVDGDGVEDVVVGAPWDGEVFVNPGQPPFDPGGYDDDYDNGVVRVFSGVDGSELLSILGTNRYEQLGFQVAGVGDVDGDGHDDVAAATGLIENGMPPFPPSTVRVYSGRDGSVLHDFGAFFPDHYDGLYVRAAGDVDGDCRPDVLVHRYASLGDGAVRVFSGRDGSVLFTLENLVGGGSVAADGLGDVNGDGVGDLVTGFTRSLVGSGEAFVYTSTYDASAPGAAFCSVTDGSASACPCASPGTDPFARIAGCDVASSTGGVSLCQVEQGAGPANRATWAASGFPVGATTPVVLARSSALDAGGPVPFGDGLRCLAAPLVRVAATSAANGAATLVHGHGPVAGAGTFDYQLWFRDEPASFCTPAAFNTSNGRRLAW